MAFIKIQQSKRRFPMGSTTSLALSFGDGDSGFYESTDDTISVVIEGTSRYEISGSGIRGTKANAAALVDTNVTSTLPTLLPNRADIDVGIGSGGVDQLSLIAGGMEGLRLVEDTGVLQLSQATTGITANTGSSQGDGPLKSSYNEISVCANGGDAVTLPSAVIGYKITIINNGAQACDVFPATDDDCGAGANTAVSLAAGANITYFAYTVVIWVALT